jgi:DNA adenine methylase
LTPYARAELKAAYSPPPDADPAELARLFLIKAGMSYGRNIARPVCTGFDTRRSPAIRWGATIENLHAVAARMRRVIIENRPAVDVIALYDGARTLHYCDPPYVNSARVTSSGEYRAYEMDDAAHEALAAALKAIKGMAIVSGYRCPLYDALYRDWPRLDREAVCQSGRKTVESIWLSPGINPPVRLF